MTMLNKENIFWQQKKVFSTLLFCLVIVSSPVVAQSFPLNPFRPETFSNRIVLNTRQLIFLILENYDDVALQELELPKSDSDLLRSRAQYNPKLTVNVSRSVSNPRYANSLTSVPPITQDSLLFSYRQLFVTGTTVETGVIFDQNRARSSTNPLIPQLGDDVFAPSSLNTGQIFLTVRQELLKNAFGYTQRRLDEMNRNKSVIQREELLFRLSSLVTDTLILFWEYYLTDYNVQTSEKMLNHVRNVKKVTRRKLRLGLAESFEYDQWVALELQSENLLADVVYGKEASLRSLLSNLKLDKNLPISFEYILIDEIPSDIDSKKDLPQAYKDRSDYRAAQLRYVNAQQNIKITEQGLKPSLSLGATFGSFGYDPSFNTAFSQIIRRNYPQTSIDLKLEAPLDDLNSLVDRRNARVDLKIAKIQIEKTKRQVRDDLIEAQELVKVRYQQVNRTKKILTRSRRYYNGILRGYRSGRFAVTNIKEALDSLVQAELNFNSSRIDFNVAIIRYDLACNRLFAKYNIDIDKMLETRYPKIGRLK